MGTQKSEQNNSWLRTFSIGFTIISFSITLTIVGYSLGNNKTQTTQKPVSKMIEPAITKDANTPPLLLKSIGVNLDYYDPKTDKAGDFLFTQQKLQFDRLFMGFGFYIPGGPDNIAKYNPQPTFIVPLGTQVRSLVDGVVVATPKLWSGDYSIQVTTNGKMQKWVYETEHLINPNVKVGDKVTADQVVGEVSNFNRGAPPGFGSVEIGILKGGNPPYHVCPFLYLDPSIKENVYAKLKAFYKSWNEYKGKTIYNESVYSVPGCLTLNKIEG